MEGISLACMHLRFIGRQCERDWVCGKRFVGELARLFSAFATESTLEAIAIKTAMTMPALLLQKPHANHVNVEGIHRALSLISVHVPKFKMALVQAT